MSTRELRQALGGFATGVVVVTAAYDGCEHGMTANSFTSVSMNPPLVLVCVDNHSRMARVLERGMSFGISILAAGQEDVARHFSGKGTPDFVAQWQWIDGVPLIGESLARLLCRVSDSRVVGDHTLQIGEVEKFEHSSRAPLLFFAGSYGAPPVLVGTKPFTGNRATVR